MKVLEYLEKVKTKLNKNKEIEAVEILISEVKRYSNIKLHYHDYLESSDISKLDELLYDYLYNDKPIQYILGYSYFYGEKYYVNQNTLIPRFDTEVVVEEGMKLIEEMLKTKSCVNVVDIGTGSGIIAITIKKHFQDKVIVDAIDISKEALAVASQNKDYHNVNINLIENDLLSRINKKYDFIISNPPYIDKTTEQLNLMGSDVISYEPPLALFANDNGMYFYTQILKQSFQNLNKNGIIVFEIGYNQEQLMNELVKKYYPNSHTKCIKDYGGNPRCYIIKLEG